MELHILYDCYEKLRKYAFILKSSQGDIRIEFHKRNLHHIAGFQHLLDRHDVQKPSNKEIAYNNLRNNDQKYIKKIKSSKYYQ